MALSYRKYTASNLSPQLVTSNVIDPNKILGLHQGRNGFANLIICIAEAWYLESVRELTKKNDSAIIDKWWKNYNASQIGQAWCEVFSSLVITEAIKECGVTNLYPKATDSVAIYRNNGGVPQYNWELSNTEISQNGLVQTEDVIFANAFRASKYLKDKLKNNVKLTTTPTPGSRFYRYSEGNSSGHAGIVIAVLNGYFYTIEGNVVIDNNTLDEGVGMYRYPMEAAQDQRTGFMFYDFSSYPSSMGNISCESKDFSYTYTGLDGKTKTRKCYKDKVVVTPPVDVVKTPIEEKKIEIPKPTEEPKKDPCIPATGIFGANDTAVVKEKKCSEYIAVKIPSKDLVQNYNEMKAPLVVRDITKCDISGVIGKTLDGVYSETVIPLTNTQIAERNGSALWYRTEKEDTKKATGFGMFKDRIGNIIYVLDANNPESEQLAISGLLGFNLPNEYVNINQYGVKSLNTSLGRILYKHRSLCNLLMIGDIKGESYNQAIRDKNAESIKRGSYEYGNGFYNSNGAWKFGEQPNNWITFDSSYGLDFNEEQYRNQEFQGVNGNVWKYQIPLKTIQDAPSTKSINIYKLMSAIENTGNGLKLSKPIIILIDKVVPPPPLISQDFISILKIAGSLTALVGVPLPMDAILNGVSFAGQLENIQKNGFSNSAALFTSAFNFAKGVAPDSIKGLETDAKKLIADNVPLLEAQLKDLGKDFTSSPIVQQLEKSIKELGGPIYAYGKNAVNGFEGLKKLGNTELAQQILGLKASQLESLSTYYDNLGSGIGGVYDMRDLLGGFDFKNVQLNMANLTGQLASKTILNKLNGGASVDFISSIRNATNIANVPLMQEIILNGGAAKVFGMFPKAPELASAFMQSRINEVNETEGKLRSFAQDQRANIIAAGMGYDLKICDIFSKETQDSLVAQARNYATANVPFFLPPTINGDLAECYKYEIQKRVPKATVINCPEGWNYDPKTNRCYNETTSVGYDGGGKINFDFNPDIKLDVSVPKCIQSSFGTYVFYFRGIPLAAMRSTDGRWIAAWGGKNYFIDINNCTLLGVPPETTDKPNDLTPTPPAIALPKCITIRNGKYYYNLRYALGLNDGLISKELTDLYANTKTPIGGASPQDLISIANSIGIDTSKVTNNPTVSSALNTVDKVDNLINTLKTTSSSPIVTTGTSTGNPVVNPIVSNNPISVNPVTSNANAVTSASNSNNPILNVSQAPEEEEAYYMNGKWYLLRGGKYVEIIDCLPKKAEVYKCGIIERDGEYIFTKNGAEYKAVKNFDNDFYVFINGSYYQLDANCNPIIPQPSGKECAECEVLVTKEQQNRIKLEKAFSESKISNDSKIKELMSLLNTQTQKSLELEKQMILRSGNSTNNDSKYNELLAQLQNERERVNELSRLIQQSKTGGNNNDSVIREIITSLNQEKERSQKLEQKIAELEQKKNDNTSSNNSSNSSNEYFNNLNNISTEKSFEKEIFNEKESLPNCITFENGRYYFTGMVQNDTLKLIALNTAKGWVASYQSSYYLIDLANCKLLTGNLRRETNFTGECTDCVQNTQPRIVERSEKIVYGGFKQGLDPEVYEDCEEC